MVALELKRYNISCAHAAAKMLQKYYRGRLGKMRFRRIVLEIKKAKLREEYLRKARNERQSCGNLICKDKNKKIKFRD